MGNAEDLSVLEGCRAAPREIARLGATDRRQQRVVRHRAKSFGVPSSILVVDMHSVDGLLEMDVDYLMIPRVDGVKMQNRKLAELGNFLEA